MKKSGQLLFIYFIFLFGFSQKKINGISFVASNRVITNAAIAPVSNVNANWVTLMPFGFMKTESDTTIIFNSKKQWINERKEGIEKSVELFKNKKIKIMLKPQIWIPNGGFTGHITMKSEKDWIQFENNYEKFILFYAQIANATSCEMLCIGTELNTFITARPLFWKGLIIKIRKKYKGKITYAENWDTFTKVPFLQEMDFIGIDAYFPLSNQKTPTLKELINDWKPIALKIKKLSTTHNKKILFTEYGYQSKDYATQEPWEHSKKRVVNLKAQENALKAMYSVFWNQKWFAGGFLWKWYDNHEDSGGNLDDDYTVQNKPSEEVVNYWYSKK